MFEAKAHELDLENATKRGLKVSDKPFTGWYGPFNWANWFTIARVPMSVWGTMVYDSGSVWWGIAIIVIATCTDQFDGMVAKMTGRHSKLGEYLDPLADYGLIIWVAQWMVRNDMVGWIPLGILITAMVIIAAGSTIHSSRTGASGTSMNAKWGMVYRSAGLGAFILGDALATDTALEVTKWVGLVLIIVGVVYGFLGLRDFFGDDGSGN